MRKELILNLHCMFFISKNSVRKVTNASFPDDVENKSEKKSIYVDLRDEAPSQGYGIVTNNMDQLRDRPRSGRPRVTTPAQDHYIGSRHLRDRTTTRDVYCFNSPFAH
ncbi:uncharacterized protein LOC143242604 [Tachypleus tridentatus]|uniref:uncharacterized protein LOC143242604 n=1 Tax=Tachypleus tridentatus TaxID=6853 RepID=UPI003FD672EC